MLELLGWSRLDSLQVRPGRKHNAAAAIANFTQFTPNFQFGIVRFRAVCRTWEGGRGDELDSILGQIIHGPAIPVQCRRTEREA